MLKIRVFSGFNGKSLIFCGEANPNDFIDKEKWSYIREKELRLVVSGLDQGPLKVTWNDRKKMFKKN